MTLPIALPPSPPPSDLADAVAAVQGAPDRQELWDQAEKLAADHQRPEDVALAYDAAINDTLPPEVALELCERAVGFLAEWFEDGSAMNAVLERAIAIDPAADWAFRRLTMQLTVACRWEELLALYDRVIAKTEATTRRSELYGEAAQIAKDLAGRSDRAIEYLEALAQLSPSDAQITVSLERLFEREGRWRELVDLWRSHLTELAKPAALARRAQIAACLLDKLSSPAEALDEALHLMGEASPALREAPLASQPSPPIADAVTILERVFAFPGAPAEVRARALGELRRHYGASARPSDIIRVLEVALGSAAPDERASLHREIAELYAGEGKDAEALGHYAELLAIDPSSDTALVRLRDVANRTARLDRYADALARAADAALEGGGAARAVTLLSEAARVRADEIADPAGATELYQRVFHAAGVDDATMLEVCRRLDKLLAHEGDAPPAAGSEQARLEVLERRATLEPKTKEQQRLRAEAAQLADALGDPDRALASWERVLTENEATRAAHDAVIAILEREERWEPLIAALIRSANAKNAKDAAREHRVRAARVYETKLGAFDAAVAAWREIETRFGQSEETIDALASLLGSAKRWDELAAVLEHGLELTLDSGRRISLLEQLGDLFRTHSAQPARALDCYLGVLAEQPAHPGALAGARALLADPACRVQATELLLQAFEATGDWEGRLSLLDPRLEAAKDDAARTRLLLEAADLREERAHDANAALGDVARALPLSPEDTAIESRLARLAEATNDFATAARALGDAVAAGPPAARAAELHFHRGALLEDRLNDAAGALAAYLAALALAEDRADVAAAAVRTALGGLRGAHEGGFGGPTPPIENAPQWDVAARTVVVSARARGASDAGLLERVAEAARPQAWDLATGALQGAVDGEPRLSPPLAAELLRTVASWHRDERHDVGAAERVLLGALERGGKSVDTLEMLAGVQRGAPGKPLVDTLLMLADAGQQVLASLHEAAQVAVDALGDAALSRPILERLLAESSTRLHGHGHEEGPDPAGPGAPPSSASLASYAIGKLVRLAQAEGDPGRAVKILVDAAELPLGADAARERLHEAAVIAEDQLADPDRAVALYRRILADSPSDAAAIGRLSTIFEGKGSVPDLLALRRHELALAEGTEAKITLRLAIAELLGRAGDRAARLAVLRDNLADEPGHVRSLEELAALLEAEAEHADLATVFEQQAAELEARDEHARAAELWTRASTIAEGKLHDLGRALEDRRRATVGRPTAETFDALARLSTALTDYAGAVGWLEKRLDSLPGDDADSRIATIARLAEALGGAGRPDEARLRLEEGLVAHPGAEALRAPLRGLYREAGAWDALVALLSGDRDGGASTLKIDELREAADVCLKKLGSRERAIPILKAMVALAPTDRPARLSLAAALRGAGELEEARGILTHLLEEYGRRRPPERAEVHFQLAQVAAAAGQAAEAKSQLETATSMSTEHAGALRMLAELSRDSGDLVKAERMFGALLLTALRQKPGTEDDPERPARSEVMINLYWILGKLQQQGRADEMLASAFEAARRSEVEARRLEDALRAAGDNALYLRALEARLTSSDLAPADRATVLSNMAEVLGGPLDRPDDAFRALLQALELDPASAGLRERAAGMARRAGAIGRWAEALAGLAREAEAEGRAPLAAGLYLALGEIQESDLGDAAQALAFYQQAERLGADPMSSWRAVARAATRVGDGAEQIRVLRLITSAAPGKSSVPPPSRHSSPPPNHAAADEATQIEDLYRLAELELASPPDVTAGLASLEWALGREPNFNRAGTALRGAAEASGDQAVLLVYERVARAAGDLPMLLDALERSAASGTAGMDVLREAVDLATVAGESARVEALLQRAVAMGEASPSGMGEAVWALVKLAEKSVELGDFEGALSHLGRATEAAEHDEAQRLTARAVQIAIDHLHQPKLAAEAWERMLARDRQDRDVWQPLLEIYRAIGDHAVLEAKLRDAIDCAFDAGFRADLRVELAKLIEPSRPDEAAAELDEVLKDNDDNDAAAAVLTRIYERQGREEDLAALLDRRLSSARARDDAEGVLQISLRLGSIVERTRPIDAIDIYRAALDVAPSSLELLGRLLALFGDDDRKEDRADVLERMLALTHGPEASERATALADLRSSLGDENGASRALELGFRANPVAGTIRDRLATIYTDGNRWADLATMLELEGTNLGGAAGISRLREAAALFLDRLDLPADAARALGMAAERSPGDLALLVDLARCLGRAGDGAAARERLGAALSGNLSAANRVSLLRLRAELSAEEPELALADLEAAHAIDPHGVARELADALDLRRASPDASHDQALLLRLVDLRVDAGDDARARDALTSYLQEVPTDLVVLRKATELDAYTGHWDGAVQYCEKLVELTQGHEKVQAAVLLAGACTQAGYPHDARPVLESVFAQNPADPELRDRLRHIYEEVGAWRELADLYLGESRLATETGDRFASLRRAGTLLLESAADPVAAIAPLEAARELKPRDNEVAMLLADAYIQSGKLQEAADFLDAAIAAQKGRRSREVSMMQLRMAQIARTVSDRTNELAWLNAAFESDAQNGDAAAALADVATEFGQLDVAVKALKAITLMKVPKPLSRAMAYLRQAMIAQTQGDMKKASMLAKKAQTEDPSLEEAHTFLQQLS
jgi:tetratricopeptide (TPR) repeat protein